MANDEDEGKAGGKSGALGFRIKDSRLGPQRDDLLPDEEQRLLRVLKNTHEARVDKQKRTRKERAAEKNKQPSLSASQPGMTARSGGGGKVSPYKTHPISKHFNGADPETSPLPNQYAGETNSNDQENLEYQHQLRHQYVPQFSAPKPRPAS